MPTQQITDDNVAFLVAEKAYNVARTALETQGSTGLLEWVHIPATKKLMLTNAARAAINGQPVWDVWAISCGSVPDDATHVLWRSKERLLKLLPTVFHEVGAAIAAVSPELSTASTSPADPLNDVVDYAGDEDEDEDEDEEVDEEAVAAATDSIIDTE